VLTIFYFIYKSNIERKGLVISTLFFSILTTNAIAEAIASMILVSAVVLALDRAKLIRIDNGKQTKMQEENIARE